MDILDYLSKNKFVVPEYQRDYAWELKECSQLWEDITAFFEGGGGGGVKALIKTPTSWAQLSFTPLRIKSTSWMGNNAPRL
ncbi:DUF262 domain-containing protein [Helicobacter bizzozeronii]|uniref:DUF262 domain-containing protein n=1 Tax=Helicobacter bizzozeronii TaxID=56877 RepID=UPI0022771A96|nr:DUF262 domain-containing protein [Helicobacter bizzozeronii]